MGVIGGKRCNLLVDFPERAVEGQLRIVRQDFIHIAHFDYGFRAVGCQQEGQGRAEDIERRQRLGREQIGKLGLAAI